jgi:hypothetical protein
MIRLHEHYGECAPPPVAVEKKRGEATSFSGHTLTCQWNQGPIVRLAPNRLVFNSPTAIQGNYDLLLFIHVPLSSLASAGILVLSLLPKTFTTIRVSPKGERMTNFDMAAAVLPTCSILGIKRSIV